MTALSFEQALEDARQDDDVIPTIESALAKLRRFNEDAPADMDADTILDAEDPVDVCNHYVKELKAVVYELEMYEDHLPHYKQLKEHF